MPRDGTGVYEQPFDDVVSDTPISSTVYNGFTRDVEQDLNAARPVIAGGTGGTSADAALFNLSGEKATQLVTNYDTHLWYPGSFRSAAGATGAPNAHAFAGTAYINEALADPPTNANVVIEARDLDDTEVPGLVWVREKKPTVPVPGGVWSAWTAEPNAASIATALDGKVDVIGDTMTGPLIIAPAALATASVSLNKSGGGAIAAVGGLTAGLPRWNLFLGNATAEADPQTGSDFVLSRYANAGAFLDNPFFIPRSTGLPQVSGAPTETLGIATKGYVDTKLQAAHGQCYLSLTGANLQLDPYNGNGLIVGGVMCTVPAAGVALAPTGVANITLYYIYATAAAGVVNALVFSTTTPTPLASGVWVKFGDANQTLVGMARTGGSLNWAPSEVLRASWFNPRRKLAATITNPAFTSAAHSELNSLCRQDFVTFLNREMRYSMAWANAFNSVAQQDVNINMGIDNLTGILPTGSMWSRLTNTAATESVMGPDIVCVRNIIAEGYHYVTPCGHVTAGSTSFTGFKMQVETWG